ncbi:MAG: hypothetical protein WA958_15245 [Tunicatimonas sp.]
MKFIRLLTLLAIAGLLVSTACQSRKIAYGNSYYFKATPRPVEPAPELQASVAPASVASRPLTTEAFAPARVAPPAVERAAPALTRREARQERRAQRKAIRKQLKQWLKDGPTKATQPQATQEMEGLVRIGIITGAAGAVLLLVGALAGNGFLIGLGGIILAVAVVLILVKIL